MNVLGQTKVNNQAVSCDFTIGKILVAVDLSSHSEKTAAYGAEFAKSVGASVIILHVFPPEPTVQFTSESVLESFDRNRCLMLKKLMKLIERVRKTGVKCDHDFRVGDPAEEVALAAKDLHADLIIAGGHHPGLTSRLFGLDQVPRILHRVHCPVLVYHEQSQ